MTPFDLCFVRRLRDFLENYDDERDDRKFYFGSGSAFQRRLENRDKEKESDTRDRRKEEEEIGGLRKKLANEGHPGTPPTRVKNRWLASFEFANRNTTSSITLHIQVL